ncbi:TolB family protein [Armatimonas rosea]|uniref:Tol-pal system beta propeller repeat protein TolB n=1 Tax=Armatimonas rosea TaxID=685828 RepID=A0A7W9SSX9_ARMRO|nr:DUF5050 domain-containing protein [Armatimonas rosea]MBB6051805.1 tol-pal system beta propeller repeat protein TolB [Armatimonas rosea]
MRNRISVVGITCLFSLLGLGVLVGCGGSDSRAGVGTSRSASVAFTIRWPERTRLIPLAAQSIKVEIRDSQGALLGAPKVVARPASGNTSTVVFNDLEVQTVQVKATAYPNSDGTGVAQATGTVPLVLVARQTAEATVTMDSTISRVQLGYDASPLVIGEPRTLTAQALNSLDETVLVDPSLWEWSSSNSVDFNLVPSAASATITAVNPGRVTVSVREKESGKTVAVALQNGLTLANTRIVFVSQRYGAAGIYIMNADGTNQTRLTNNTVQERSPIFSPDGKSIVYTRYDNPTEGDLYLMNVDGTGAKNLTSGPGTDAATCFTPDGSKILFTNSQTGASTIYSVNIDGSEKRRLTASSELESSPVISPDGAQIAFVRSSELWIMNVDGTGQKKLSNDPSGNVSGISFSPNGKRIMYNFYKNLNTSICIMNSDGTGVTQISASGRYSPRFSPDGTKIVFQANEGFGGFSNNDEIEVMNVDGSQVVRLTTVDGHDTAPSWSGFVF